MAAVIHDHNACEVKIAMLEDDIQALHAELLNAYCKIEEYQNPLAHIINVLTGGGNFEFKYEPEVLRALDKG